MKQKLFPSLLLATLLLAASTASAQGVRANVNSSATATPASVRTQTEVKAEAQTRAASTSEARAEMQLSIVKRVVSNVTRVLTATVDRLEQIIVRIESRIAKFKAAGATTTESEGFVAEAKVHLDKAEASIRALASVELEGDSVRENFLKVRALAAEAKMHIREAHTSLMKTVRSLKASSGARVEGEANATTTSN